MTIGTEPGRVSARSIQLITDLRRIEVPAVIALACWGQREGKKHTFSATSRTTLLDLIQSNDPVTQFEVLDSRTDLSDHTGDLMTTCDRKVLNEEPAGCEDVLSRTSQPTRSRGSGLDEISLESVRHTV